MKPIYRSNGSYLSRIIASQPLVYFPLNEKSGTVAKNWGTLGAAANGSYTGVDLAAASGPKGGVAPYFDNVNDQVNAYTASLAAAIDFNLGSINIWCKVYNAAVWSNGTWDAVAYFGADGSNYFNLFKTSAVNMLYYNRCSQGVDEMCTNVPSGGPVNWFMLSSTFDDVNNLTRYYLNGTEIAASPKVAGTIVGTLSAIKAYIGKGWIGYLAHCALWTRVLTPTEITRLYQ